MSFPLVEMGEFKQGMGPPVGTHQRSSYKKKWACSFFLRLGRGGVSPLSGVFERGTFQDKRHTDVRAPARAAPEQGVYATTAGFNTSRLKSHLPDDLH